MHKLQLAQIARLYYLLSLLQIQSSSSAASPPSNSLTSQSSLIGIPEASLPETGAPSSSSNITVDQRDAFSNDEDLAIKEEIENYITRVGSIREAFRMAIDEGKKEVVFYLLQNEPIDKQDINEALLTAKFKGHKEIVGRLIKDQRIEISSIKGMFYCAYMSGDWETVSFFLDDQRIRLVDIKDALHASIIKGYNEIALAILEDKRIEAEYFKIMFSTACSIGAVNLVPRFLMDQRISAEDVQIILSSVRNRKVFSLLIQDPLVNAEAVNNALMMASRMGNRKSFFMILKDERIETSSVLNAFESAAENGHKDIVFPLIEDRRLEDDDIKKAFQSSCSGFASKDGINWKDLIISRLLKDTRIKVDDIKDAFQKACSEGSTETIQLLIIDHRIESADINEGFGNLPSQMGQFLTNIFLDDERLHSSHVNDCFIRACVQECTPIITRLLKDHRLNTDGVNQGFAKLSSMNIHIIIHFLEDDRLELQFVRKILLEIFAKDQLSHLDKLERLSLNVIDIIKRESVKVFSPDQIVFLLQKSWIDILDLDYVDIIKIIQILRPDMFSLYFLKLLEKSSFILENLDKSPALVAKEVAQMPKWSLHFCNALQWFFKLDGSSRIIDLLVKIALIYFKLEALSDVPHLQRAQTFLLFVPHQLVLSINELIHKVENVPFLCLITRFLDKVAGANVKRKKYTRAFNEFLNNDFDGNKDNVIRKFLELHWGPEMCSREVKMAKKLIAIDLRSSKNPKSFLYDIYYHTDRAVIEWIVGAWESGKRELIDFVVETLVDHWEYKEFVDRLIVQIVEHNPKMISLQLYVVDNNLETVLKFLVKTTSIFSQRNLYVENFSFEQIHELALDENTFFGQSFTLISDPNVPGFESNNFIITYFNEKGGLDQGGPSRNWIEKMLHAMADPRRQFLKTHGVKNQLVPDIGVDQKVFFALGRLIGKAISKNAGLPFAFHPKWIQIMKEPLDRKFIRRCFKEFYEEELKMIDGLLTYTEGDDFDEISSYEFASISVWHSTSEIKIRNYMIFNVQDVNRVKPKKIFKPKTRQDIIDFAKKAKRRAFSEFNASITAFMKGLDIYVKTDLLNWVQNPILSDIFSPSPEIDVESLLASFNLKSGEGFNVEISKEDKDNLDENITVMSSADRDTPLRISIKDAFEIAVKRLDSKLLPGLLGQITGSRSVGFKKLQPRMFTVNFYQIDGSRQLFGDGPSSSQNVQLPIASSCNLSITMPVYGTLKEMCDALELLARGADDFFFK